MIARLLIDSCKDPLSFGTTTEISIASGDIMRDHCHIGARMMKAHDYRR